MSISAIGASSSILSFQDFAAPTSPQRSVNQLVSQLEESIKAGNLDTTKTTLQSLQKLVPSQTGNSDPLSTFLNSVSAAVTDSSTTEAQTALATYEEAIAGPAKASDTTNAENLATGTQLMEDHVTLSLVKMTIEPKNYNTSTSDTSSTSDSSSSSTADIGSLYKATA
jgi:hypothetical protein